MITLQSAFAQTGDTPAPSPLHNKPAVNPASAPDPDPTTSQQKKHGRHRRRSGTSSTGAAGSQNN
jgi:hypothetical protein